MKYINIFSDIIPIGEFRSIMAKWLKITRNTGQPLIITQNGRPAAVLLSPEEFDNMQYNKLFVDLVTDGITDIKTDDIFETNELNRRINKDTNIINC